MVGSLWVEAIEVDVLQQEFYGLDGHPGAGALVAGYPLGTAALDDAAAQDLRVRAHHHRARAHHGNYAALVERRGLEQGDRVIGDEQVDVAVGGAQLV